MEDFSGSVLLFELDELFFGSSSFLRDDECLDEEEDLATDLLFELLDEEGFFSSTFVRDEDERCFEEEADLPSDFRELI